MDIDQNRIQRTWKLRGFFLTLLAALLVVLIFPQLTRADEAAIIESENMQAHLAAVEALDGEPAIVLPEGMDLESFVQESSAAPVGPPLIIPAADLNGDSQASDYFYSFAVGRYGSGDGCHMAPVYIPHGGSESTITIVNFWIFGYDNNATQDVTYLLRRKNLNTTGSAGDLGSVSTSGNSTNIQVVGDQTIDDAVVSDNFAYYITWCWPSGGNAGIQGFWIFYSES